MPEEPSQKRWTTVLFLVIWLLCCLYMWINLRRGWVPHDEGTLAQAADRVLRGELPHRDFDDPYTGGLSYLDAAAFRFLGTNLLTLRIVLFVFFMAWVPAVFAIARQFARPWPAAAVSIAAAAWSVPNYAAALPSWFCLFFATFGALAILKYVRKPHAHFLFLAGLCGGLSFLVKISGLYFIAGALLLFVYREQCLAATANPLQKRSYTYLAFLVFCLTIFAAAINRLILTTGGIAEFAHFVYPPIAIVVFLILREDRCRRTDSIARFTQLFAMLSPFAVGVLLPLLSFLAIYLPRRAVHPLIEGVFILPLRRTLEASMPAPSAGRLIPCLAAVFFLLQVARLSGAVRIAVSVSLTALSLLLLFTSRSNAVSYQLLFQSVRNLVPVVATASLIALFVRQKKLALDDPRGQQIMLLTCVTVMCSLIQFPFPTATYFCYIAPLAILFAAALLSILPNPPKLFLYSALTVSVLFAAFVFRPGFIDSMDLRYHPDVQTATLTSPRAAGLQVEQSSANQYNELISFVNGLAINRPILAGPDSPEVYFLTAHNNPTPVFFDFFYDSKAYKELMEKVLDRPGFIKVVVLKLHPRFSRNNQQVLHSLVASRFPQSRQFSSFEVFWRP